jgi:hypothetical protein
MNKDIVLRLSAVCIALSMVSIAATQFLTYRRGLEPQQVRVVESVPLQIDWINDTIDIAGPVTIGKVQEPITVNGQVDVANVGRVLTPVEVRVQR